MSAWICFQHGALAQSVGIGTESPHASAALDIQSTGKGMLVPRLSTAQRMSIPSPAQGLLVFDTDINSFCYYAMSGWTVIVAGTPAMLADTDGDTDVHVEKNPDEDIIRFRLAGQERWQMRSSRLEPIGTGGSVFVGRAAGANDDLSANDNIAIGDSALYACTTGNKNTAIGTWALRSTVASFQNTAVGYASLRRNTTGHSNTAIGLDAMTENINGSNNTAVGGAALKANTAGNDNAALGGSALRFNTLGSNNAAVGQYALNQNLTGSGNSALGHGALWQNTTGGHNTAVGRDALRQNTASGNTAVGAFALSDNTTGISNTACGSSSLGNNTTGAQNSAFGSALINNTTGWFNTAAGDQALFSNTVGDDNTAMGAGALYANTTGDANAGFGMNALSDNTTGYQNTAAGHSALASNTEGYGNTSMGYSALSVNLLGDYNTCLGHNADFNSGSKNNATAIGAQAIVDASNKVRVGNSSVTSIGGQVGWTTYSDQRIKTDVREDVAGLAFITALRPVTYRYDIRRQAQLFAVPDTAQWPEKHDIEAIRFSGFIAQDVLDAAAVAQYPFSGIDTTGTLMGLRYAEFVVPLVKAVQEQQAVIETLTASNAALMEAVAQIRMDMARSQQNVHSDPEH